MTGRTFIQKLHNGTPVFGSAITQPCPLWTQIAKEIGLDFVFIDNEHRPFSRNDVANLCQIYAALEIVPLVRIPTPDASLACMTLDSGAWGIVAPYIESVAEVEELVGAVKYSPLKGEILKKGQKTGCWPSQTLELLNQRNFHRSVIINIESHPAVKKLDQLASVPGLDAFLIGPHDLTINSGYPEDYEHPDFIRDVEEIICIGRKHQLGVGIHAWWGTSPVLKWMDKGLNLILYSSDYVAARQKLEEDFKKLQRNK